MEHSAAARRDRIDCLEPRQAETASLWEGETGAALCVLLPMIESRDTHVVPFSSPDGANQTALPDVIAEPDVPWAAWPQRAHSMAARPIRRARRKQPALTMPVYAEGLFT